MERLPPSIVTMDKDPLSLLLTPTTPFDFNSLDERKEAEVVVARLWEAFKPLLPAAGLAAPQIAISRQAFLYSWDRSEEQVQVVLNPTYQSCHEGVEAGWEGCFSTLLAEKGPYRLVFVERERKILVHHFNEHGELVRQLLSQFAARVYQHEYDHLHGIVCVNKPGCEVKSFDSREECLAFMKSVKEQNRVQYIAPLRV